MLDDQIAVRARFRAQAEEDYTTWLRNLLGREPNKTDREVEGRWWKFIQGSEKYSGDWPGFYSSQVDAQQGHRDKSGYHQSERDWLVLELQKLEDEITVDLYEVLVRSFPGRLACRDTGARSPHISTRGARSSL